MTCIPNAQSEELEDSQWHNYAVIKSATETVSYDSDDEVSGVKHTETLQFYVDGKKTSDPTTLAGWGMTDCSGSASSYFTVPEKNNDDFMGKQLPYNVLTPPPDLWDQTLISTLFPMNNLLPFGVNNATGGITALRFTGVRLPRNAIIKRASLIVCAADVPVFWTLKKEECDEISMPSHVELQIVADTSTLSKDPRNLPSKMKDCCAFASAPVTSNRTIWNVSVEDWRRDAVLPNWGSDTTVRKNAGNDGDCSAQVDMTEVIAEVVENANWGWDQSLTLLVASAQRTMNIDTCDSKTECDDAFLTQQKTTVRGGLTKSAQTCVDTTGKNITASVCACGKNSGGASVFCEIGAMCHIWSGVGSCLGFSDIAWREANRGPDFDRCRFFYELAKPLEQS